VTRAIHGAPAEALRQALKALDSDERAKDVLLALSDPTREVISVATTKAACGAWPGRQS